MKHAMTCIVFFLLLTAATAFAQGTAFTHQGRLTDNNIAANGAYDLQFALFDAVTGGAQQGATINRDDVAVTNGVFTVALDFGATPFNGAARWLQISVRAGASTGAFTTLTPRQPLSATPYAIRSQVAANADNAAQLGGVAANQYVQTNDTRLSDARTPAAGSANYIQNTTTQQAASNFNISGDGTAGGTLNGNVVNATTQFNLNGARILSNAGTANLFAGESAGAANTSGAFNTLIGRRAGQNVTTGSGNVFLGNDTGAAARTSNSNTLIGSGANLIADGLSFAAAIGAGATVANSNSIVLGRGDGSDTVRFPGPILANAITATGPINANGGFNVSGGLSIGGHLTAGSIGTSGLISTLGGLSVRNHIILNDAEIRLRDGNDANHAIYYNRDVDGILFRAQDQFSWVRSANNIEVMRLNSNGVLRAVGFNGRCVDLFIGNGNCNQDLAETFRTKEQTEPGEVVTIIPTDHERPTVRRALRAYDEHLVGVVSTSPGLVFDEGETHLAGKNDHYITKDKTVVAAVGRVPVKFTLENGAINVGDALTSSATEPGKAMKATGEGKIIGIALESSAKAKDGKLLLWLQVGHYTPPSQRAEWQAIKAENAELKAQLSAVWARLEQLQKQH